MKYNPILIPILSLIFFACQNRAQESPSVPNSGHIDIESGSEKPNETISQSQNWANLLEKLYDLEYRPLAESRFNYF